MRQYVQMVAPLQREDDAPPAEFAGHGDQFPGDAGIASQRELHHRQGVLPVGVVPGGDQDQVGAEPAGQRPDQFFVHPQVPLIAHSGRERDVEDGPLPLADPRLLPVAGAGVVGVLVGGEIEDGGVGFKDGLGAVAVMDVYIGDEDAVDAREGLGVAGGNGDVVEEAEAHAPVGEGMVARWADQGEAVLHPSLHHGLHQGQEPPGGHDGRVVGASVHVGVGVQVAPAPLRHPPHLGDVGRGVDPGQFLFGGRAGLYGRQPLQEPRVPEGGHNSFQAAGVLRMAGLVMLQIDGVIYVTGRHRAPPRGDSHKGHRVSLCLCVRIIVNQRGGLSNLRLTDHHRWWT